MPPFFMNALESRAQGRLVAILVDSPDAAIVEENIEGIACILHAVSELRGCPAITHCIIKSVVGGLPIAYAKRTRWACGAD